MRGIVLVVSLGAAAVVAAVLAMHGVLGPVRSLATHDASARRPALRLEADPTVSAPHGLTAGSEFSYGFTVTNTGRAPYRNLAVRSEKVIGGRAGEGLDVLSVSDQACVASGTVVCLFSSLAPGESRAVQVRARAAASRHPGDTLRIRTFLARIAPAGPQGVNYDMIGEASETTGRFG